MSSLPPVIMWFRGDLRLADNPALVAACEGDRPVIPLFILDDSHDLRPLGGASRWWLDKSLRSLARGLAALGAKLVLRRGNALEVLRSMISASGASAVFWNRLYDPQTVARDRALKDALTGSGIECHSFNGSLLSEPWEIRTATGGPFKVFSAFWRTAGPQAGREAPLQVPARITRFENDAESDLIETWGLHPSSPDWSQGFSTWEPGETGAQARLDLFLQQNIDGYGHRRDQPGQEGTSRLSPHLHFGEIGPRQIWAACDGAVERGAPQGDVATFQKELGWREFNQHLLFNFPATATSNLDSRFDSFPWRKNHRGLAAWRRGRTGFPIVDAGMRQLWSTGWMHNRVRMIAASFLIKDLLVNWRVGEDWFWDTLVDADVANNVGGWQWVAGSGADAAPYFRVFNPVLQGQKFDPGGDYVRRWIPELSRLPNASIHAPWLADRDVLAAAGVDLGRTYPAPIVDHARARERALALFQGLS